MIYGYMLKPINEGLFDNIKRKREEKINKRREELKNKEQKFQEICEEVTPWLNNEFIPKLLTTSYKNKIKKAMVDALNNGDLNLEEAKKYVKAGEFPTIKAEADKVDGIIFIFHNIAGEIDSLLSFVLDDIIKGIKEKFNYKFDIMDDNVSIYPIYPYKSTNESTLL